MDTMNAARRQNPGLIKYVRAREDPDIPKP